MKLDIVIMGHVSRAEQHKYLQEQLGAYTKFSIDDGTLGTWGNCKRSWNMIDPKSDYGLVLQDDAILTEKFINKASTFISKHKGQTISFYYGRRPATDHYARNAKDGYFDMDLAHGVAIAMPTFEIPSMIRACDKYPEIMTDDMRMKRRLKALGRRCRYSYPSLVNHARLPSIVDPTKPIREALKFE